MKIILFPSSNTVVSKPNIFLNTATNPYLSFYIPFASLPYFLAPRLHVIFFFSPRNSPRTSPARRTPSPNERRKTNARSTRSKVPQTHGGFSGTTKTVGSPRSAFSDKHREKQRSEQRRKGPSPSSIELNQINGNVDIGADVSGLPKNAVWAGSKKLDDASIDAAGTANALLPGEFATTSSSITSNMKRTGRIGRLDRRDEQFLHQSISEKPGRVKDSTARFGREFVESKFKLPHSRSGASSVASSDGGNNSSGSSVPGPKSGGESPDLGSLLVRGRIGRTKRTSRPIPAAGPSRQTLRNTKSSYNRDRSKSWDPAARRRRARVSALEAAYGSKGDKKVVVPTTSSSSSSQKKKKDELAAKKNKTISTKESTKTYNGISTTSDSNNKSESPEAQTPSRDSPKVTAVRSYSQAVLNGGNIISLEDIILGDLDVEKEKNPKKEVVSENNKIATTDEKIDKEVKQMKKEASAHKEDEEEQPLDVSTIDKLLLMLLKQRDLATKGSNDPRPARDKNTEHLLKELDALKERIDLDAMVETTMNAGEVSLLICWFIFLFFVCQLNT